MGKRAVTGASLCAVGLLLLCVATCAEDKIDEAAEQAAAKLVESLPEVNATEVEDLPSIAQMIDQTLREEFPEGMDEFSAGKTFNTSITYRTVGSSHVPWCWAQTWASSCHQAPHHLNYAGSQCHAGQAGDSPSRHPGQPGSLALRGRDGTALAFPP